MKNIRIILSLALFSILFISCGGKNKGASLSDSKILKRLETVYYDFDKSSLRSDARENLKRNALWLQGNSQGKLFIEGHTDKLGTNEYNLALGERRALAAKSYLVTLGIPASRIATISYGEEKPSDFSETESAHSQNRRAESIVRK